MNKTKILSAILPLLCQMACTGGENVIAVNTPVRVASYNLRYYNAADSASGNSWEHRRKSVADVIEKHGFEIFGTQEACPKQLKELRGLLKGYDFVGYGRNEGRTADDTYAQTSDEFCAIFYDTAKFDLLEDSTFWLSQTPGVPSRGWDAALNRICTWGLFRHKATGKELYFFNLHMDHFGKRCLKESAALVLDAIKQKTGGRTPAILTGDFNMKDDAEAFGVFVGDGYLINAFRSAREKELPTTTTFNNFDISKDDGQRIDHILATKNVLLQRFAIKTDRYRTTGSDGKTVTRLPSDHYPLLLDILLE